MGALTTSFPILYGGPPPVTLNLDSLFAASEVGGYYSFQDLSKLAQNSDGSGAAAVGSPVGYVEDLSGNGNHLVTLTTARRPTLQQDAGGNYYLDFDGVDDEFRWYSAAGGLSGETLSVLLAIESTKSWAVLPPLFDPNRSRVGSSWQNGSATSWQGGNGSTASLIVNGASESVTSRDDVHTLLATGNKTPVQLDYTAFGSYTAADGYWFGGYLPSTSASFGGKVYAFAWRIDPITGADITLANDWMKQEMGI